MSEERTSVISPNRSTSSSLSSSSSSAAAGGAAFVAASCTAAVVGAAPTTAPDACTVAFATVCNMEISSQACKPGRAHPCWAGCEGAGRSPAQIAAAQEIRTTDSSKVAGTWKQVCRLCYKLQLTATACGPGFQDLPLCVVCCHGWVAGK